jgi:uncharacterized membrane protein
LSLQDVFSTVASTLKLITEISSVVIIGTGLVVAFYFFMRTIIFKQKKEYLKLRISLGRFLVIALELQLAADIIGTAIAPSWEQIGQLAAIALIRTFLSYFLNMEMKTEEREKLDADKLHKALEHT